MPELPEVEVVKKSLKNKIIDLSFRKVLINTNKLRYTINKDLNKIIINKKILSIDRRSKYILINLEKNITILTHLGMTGKFFLVDKKKIHSKTSFYYKISNRDKKHNHVIFFLNNDTKLIYNDIRKFGFIKFDQFSKLKDNCHLKILGPEPLEKIFNFKYFKNYIKKKNRIIKNLLMEQKFVSGLGNIYVNEILFFSKINPIRRTTSLKDIEIKKILKNTKKILKKAISFGGSSIKNFSSSRGKTGSFQQYFNVYGKKGSNCSNTDCNGNIKKIFLSNRSSFFCTKCQK